MRKKKIVVRWEYWLLEERNDFHLPIPDQQKACSQYSIIISLSTQIVVKMSEFNTLSIEVLHLSLRHPHATLQKTYVQREFLMHHTQARHPHHPRVKQSLITPSGTEVTVVICSAFLLPSPFSLMPKNVKNLKLCVHIILPIEMMGNSQCLMKKC